MAWSKQLPILPERHDTLAASPAFSSEVRLEEEEEEIDYDPTIVYEQMKELEQTKDKMYKDPFDKAFQLQKDLKEAEEQYENGKTKEQRKAKKKAYEQEEARPNQDESEDKPNEALETAKKEYEAAKSADEVAQAKVKELEDRLEEAKVVSFKEQYKAHAMDLNDIKADSKYKALEKQILSYEALFNVVPEIQYDSKPEELTLFKKHLDEALLFWNDLYNEAKKSKDTSARLLKTHQKCKDVTEALNKIIT